ncbi:hypothetical protein K2Z83_04615 [Oscillochloris sp. ZM17-4]|uniref:hypothetical protein n=1 Tax=Oscillochloris sp. ZM17-4 TaxID=2866714 RepID=UPI001C72FD18|nr:hypothetical protein [Oscillochloris sp. ZM17-4]MBX0326964.1 hypothetical protein [Oscillochloris sp. ZM17-4]
MGSDTVDLYDLKLKASDKKSWHEPGRIYLEFTCPRCDTCNDISLSAEELLGDVEIVCQHPYCGGKKHFLFTMRLEGSGFATSILSRPVGKGSGTLYRVTGKITYLNADNSIHSIAIVNRIIEADNPDSATMSVVEAAYPDGAGGSEDDLTAKAIGPTLQSIAKRRRGEQE